MEERPACPASPVSGSQPCGQPGTEHFHPPSQEVELRGQPRPHARCVLLPQRLSLPAPHPHPGQCPPCFLSIETDTTARADGEGGPPPLPGCGKEAGPGPAVTTGAPGLEDGSQGRGEECVPNVATGRRSPEGGTTPPGLRPVHRKAEPPERVPNSADSPQETNSTRCEMLTSLSHPGKLRPRSPGDPAPPA